MLYILKSKMEGTYNAVAPDAVGFRELCTRIAKQRGNSVVFISAPQTWIRRILGDMSELFLSSQKVSSEKISSRGFVFDFPSIEDALDDLVHPLQSPL